MQDFREIQLTRGQVAKVDCEDFERINQWKWHVADNFYAKRREFVGGKPVAWKRMHREVIGAQPGQVVDHINGDRLDNRRANLRICTQQQNLFNSKKHKDCTSRFKGVFWSRQAQKWQTRIRAEGKSKHLGYSLNEVDAAILYNQAAARYFGEFARLNEVSQ